MISIILILCVVELFSIVLLALKQKLNADGVV